MLQVFTARVVRLQGSGKTLAFSIPLIHHILQERELEQDSQNCEGITNLEPAEDHVDDMSVDGDNNTGWSLLCFSRRIGQVLIPPINSIHISNYLQIFVISKLKHLY